ncbi:MAG: cytochrome c oxidase cbb3-type subunit 4 [Cellvibrionaceae bacterium]
MDINDIYSFSTVFMMIAFISICWWAYAPSRKKRFNDDANLPFADEEKHQQSQAAANQRFDKTDATDNRQD